MWLVGKNFQINIKQCCKEFDTFIPVHPWKKEKYENCFSECLDYKSLLGKTIEILFIRFLECIHALISFLVEYDPYIIIKANVLAI